MGIGLFGLGMFISSMTFVNAYIAQGAIPSGRSQRLRYGHPAARFEPIVASLLLFLVGVALAAAAI